MKSAVPFVSILGLAIVAAAGAAEPRDFLGPRISSAPSTSANQSPRNAVDSIHRWSQIAIDATGLDHTPVAPGELRTFGEQLGPGRAARAMAIVHIAMFDSANAVLGGYQLARLLALVNTAMADTGMAVWESKYFYNFWRPVTGIRESDPGTGPTMLGDGNPNTAGDPTFVPMGAPASNLTGVNFTPPFPSYPSGHGGFGGAIFQTMRRFFGTDNIPFTFVSDEFNGVTKDNAGNTRPLMPRSFTTLSQAEEENGQSRIYLGIHWQFDKTAAITQGRNVANYVFDHAFLPAGKH